MTITNYTDLELRLQAELAELKAEHIAYISRTGARILALHDELGELKAKLAEVPQIHTTPVAYQYKYGDYWRCSNGEQINGSYPTKARSLYVMKDEI